MAIPWSLINNVSGLMVSTVSSLPSLSLMSGISLILLGLVCFIVSPQLEAALVSLVQSWTALVSGEVQCCIHWRYFLQLNIPLGQNPAE